MNKKNDVKKLLNLYEKIQAVSMKVKNIEKDISVGSGNYSYKAVSDLAVTLAIKEAEFEFRLISIPIKQELVSSETIKTLNGQKETLKFIDNIKMTVKIIDLDDTTQFLEVESFGKGVDSGDKGFGKASTYARKYALLNVYKIATGEDPDADKSQDISTPKTVDEKTVVLMNYFDKETDKLQAILKHFNVGEFSQLSDKEVATVYSTYKQKKLI